jgi:dienelactone hydrolase
MQNAARFGLRDQPQGVITREPAAAPVLARASGRWAVARSGRRGPTSRAARCGGLAALVAGAVVAACRSDAPPTYVPRDPALRGSAFYFYPAVDTTRDLRALVIFLGNDVGFWAPHRTLAARLARANYAVVGVDIRTLLAGLPSDPRAREQALAASITALSGAARRELRAERAPLIIAGHSLGAEVALWVAAYVRPPGTVGVLALSPGGYSHLAITASDLLGRDPEPGPSSFDVAETLHRVPADERVAVVRGSGDGFRRVDPALAAAGGDRYAHYSVPFASHSLKGLLLAGPIVERALDWILAGRPSVGNRADTSAITSASTRGSAMPPGAAR